MKTTTTPMQPPSKGRVRILLCGYGHLGYALLEGLLACADRCEVVGVFRWSARPGGKSYWEPIEDAFQQRVADLKLPDLQCKGMNSYEFADLLQQYQPDVVLVGSWGEILRKHLLNLPTPLIINCHPSKLPAHRGANPYASVILENETETGVTFHRMAPKIDAGAIILQRAIPLTSTDDGSAVRDKCAETAQEMVSQLVDLLNAHFTNDKPLPEQEQDHAKQSYFPQLKQEDGQLNWQDSPDKMLRQMRAIYPWIACYSRLEGRQNVLLFDPYFMDGDSQGHPPGTIVCFDRGAIYIALSDPEQLLKVTSYQFGWFSSYMPMWLCMILAPFILKPGRRFTSIAKQPER